MSLIKTGGTLQMVSIIENANGDVEMVNAVDGSKFNLVPKQQMRQFKYNDDLTKIAVYDAILDVEYWSPVNELEDPTVTEVECTGTVTLTGVAGSVDGISVDGVELMTGAIGNAVLASVNPVITPATATATLLGVGVGDTVTINGNLYTAVSGTKANNEQFDIDGDDTADALDLVDSINNDVRVGTLGIVTASSALGVVTLTSDQSGSAGNATTLAKTGTTITISGAVFTGGDDADTITVNGLKYTSTGSAEVDYTYFTVGAGDTADAVRLARAVNGDVRVGTLGDVSAVAVGDTVYFTQTVAGQGGDATTLAETGSTITISGATFTGAIPFDTDLTITALAVVNNINAGPQSANFLASRVAGVITIQSKATNKTQDNGDTLVSETTTLVGTDVDLASGVTNLIADTGNDQADYDTVVALLSVFIGKI